jgi:GT2 family glycosyltransferase
MFRREVYEQVGGLDTGFFMFCEEPDFCERAAQAGWRTVYVPQARITHFESTTVSRYPLLKMRHYHLSPLYYFRKRHRPMSVLVLKLGFIIELSVKYFLRVIQNALKPHDSLRARIQAYPIVIKEIWHY